MPTDRDVTLYLPPALRRRAEAGTHGFLSVLLTVLRSAGLNPVFATRGPGYEIAAAERPGHGIFLMDEPANPRILTIRQSYFGPFWRIERTARRWDWPVARTPFDPDKVDRAAADRFVRWWGRHLFGDAVTQRRRAGYLYLPLQARLLDRRSFQACSPVEMIEATLAHDPRPVVATLHPGAIYAEAERAMLAELAARHPRLTVETGEMVRHLRDCDAVVTQNSSVGFLGHFFEKPLVLFARIDFAHLAGEVDRLGVPGALATLGGPPQDHAGYLWWFQNRMAINAADPGAPDRIRARLADAGWPV